MNGDDDDIMVVEARESGESGESDESDKNVRE